MHSSLVTQLGEIADNFMSAIYRPVVLGNPWFAPRILVVLIVFVVSLISANPTLNSLFVAV